MTVSNYDQTTGKYHRSRRKIGESGWTPIRWVSGENFIIDHGPDAGVMRYRLHPYGFFTTLAEAQQRLPGLTWEPERWISFCKTFTIIDNGEGSPHGKRFTLIDGLTRDTKPFPLLNDAQAAAVPDGANLPPCPVCDGRRICTCDNVSIKAA